MKKIILRSASPRRKDLLMKAGYSFDILAADVDEDFLEGLSPYENVKKLGLKKAMYECEKYNDSILIGCDTIVVLDNQVFGKPKNEEDAFLMLSKLSGKKHQVMSGVGIVYNKHIYNFVVVSDVYFKNLSNEDILNYIATKECFGKAGSYAIQGRGKCLISHYEGSLENIIGLPIKEVEEILGEIDGMED